MKIRSTVILLLAVWTSCPTIVSAQLPPGSAKIWEDRGDLTPAKVYWGYASRYSDPASRRPTPPFKKFEKDATKDSFSPKCKGTDSKGVKWTIKFNPKENSEVHSEIASTRLAWALGFGVDEDYYVADAKIEGIAPGTDLGKASGYIQPDGAIHETRLKRHNKDADHLANDKGEDLIWDEARNPGVPAEQLSGLLIFDVMTHNYDAQPKNCKILHLDGPSGPENWYIMSDMGATFGGGKSKWNLANYQKEASFIKSVDNGFVVMNFFDAIPKQVQIHSKIPLAHAQWFRKSLEKLTDDEIVAAFNAAFESNAMDEAYAAGDAAKINELTSPEVKAYAAKFREKIEEFKSKVPAGL